MAQPEVARDIAPLVQEANTLLGQATDISSNVESIIRTLHVLSSALFNPRPTVAEETAKPYPSLRDATGDMTVENNILTAQGVLHKVKSDLNRPDSILLDLIERTASRSTGERTVGPAYDAPAPRASRY